MKKKVLFVYPEMMMGGSTTSLLSLLHNFDYTRYDVDLLLYRNRGPYLEYIPKTVNLLPQAMIESPKIFRVLKTLLNGQLIKTYYLGLKYYKRIQRASQQSAYAQATLCRKIEKKYDVAIGFLELWSDVFVNKYIYAKKKISWIHVDFENAHYIPAIDDNTFNESDYIVTVSERCRDNFIMSFPRLKDKTVVIENILTKNYVLKRLETQETELDTDRNYLNLLSVCRLIIETKGLDRGLETVKRLTEKGYKLRWYIIGDGADEQEFRRMIKDLNCEENVFLLGAMDCPFSVYDNFDAFFLPSRYEGKPMSVTEAQMLALPPIVSEYSSASEQIDNGNTGIIVPNDMEALFEKLKVFCEDKTELKLIKEKLKNSCFDNPESLEKLYSLIERN